jgi:hypothetical protein
MKNGGRTREEGVDEVDVGHPTLVGLIELEPDVLDGSPRILGRRHDDSARYYFPSVHVDFKLLFLIESHSPSFMMDVAVATAQEEEGDAGDWLACVRQIDYIFILIFGRSFPILRKRKE